MRVPVLLAPMLGLMLALTVPMASLALGGDTAAAAKATSGPAPAADERVRILSVATSWDNISALLLGSGTATPYGNGTMFVIRGELVNESKQPIHHVVLRYELIGEDGKTLQEAEGFNGGAEHLDASGHETPGGTPTTPIAAGARDHFRMVFFSDEIPHFKTHRVSVSEVH